MKRNIPTKNGWKSLAAILFSLLGKFDTSHNRKPATGRPGSPERSSNMTDKTLITMIKRTWHLCCDSYAAGYLPLMEDSIYQQRSAPFLALDDKTQSRHIALVKKMLGYDIGNRTLRVPFDGQAPEILEQIRESRLRDSTAMEDFYNLIKTGLTPDKNYTILIYHSVYDIPCKGTDGADQQESEEVYDFILCLICPTKKSKENLCAEEEKSLLPYPTW